MIRISIGDSEREIGDANPSWIREHVELLRNQNLPVCVRITIKSGDVDMALATPGCASGACGSRPPRPKEEEIFELWEKRSLNQDDFVLGQLIAFVNQIKKI